MKISSKTVIYTMRIVGSIIILAAVGLIAYLAYFTSDFGIDGFLICGFGIGTISLVIAIVMIGLSFKITFTENVEIDSDATENQEKTDSY